MRLFDRIGEAVRMPASCKAFSTIDKLNVICVYNYDLTTTLTRTSKPLLGRLSMLGCIVPALELHQERW